MLCREMMLCSEAAVFVPVSPYCKPICRLQGEDRKMQDYKYMKDMENYSEPGPRRPPEVVVGGWAAIFRFLPSNRGPARRPPSASPMCDFRLHLYKQ